MKLAWRAAFPLLAISAWLAPASAAIPSAKVTGGEVAGTVADGLSIFKGIPFAAAPTDDLRWKAPQPVRPWAEVRRTTAFAPACVQDVAFAKVMGDSGNVSEDCLYLNVWTPAKAAGERLPVIVWIYGGGFTGGMTSVPLYDGAKLARRGVVFVSISYRVGAFGFLAHPALSRESGHGSGNYGMLDMIQGLTWVRANVAKFGGDPDRVTLLGHSAGAYAVSMLAASPLAKGLFEGVIAESGASFAPPRAADEGGSSLPSLKLAESDGERFLQALGARDIAAARALPASSVEAAAEKGLVRFWPPTDGYVVPGDQYALWQAGRFNDVAVLVGSNSDEGAMQGKRDITPAAFEAEVRKAYGQRADLILGAYDHADDDEAFRATKQLVRDTGFGWPAYAWARLQSANGKAKAFVYYFDLPTSASPDGTSHGIEVGYVFGNFRPRPGWTPDSDDFALSDVMQRYWVNFASHGDPNGADLPRWPEFKADAPVVMRLSYEPVPVSVPNWSKLDALEDYYAWRRSAAK